MGILGSVKSFLGIGESGSGGSKDAYQEFLKYSTEIGAYADRYRSRLADEGVNPLVNQLGRSYNGLDAAIAQAGAGSASRLRQMGANIPTMLRSSALANTAGAQRSALMGARMAGGGRGGLAFGGGAGALAARAGQEASVMQSSALADSLLGGVQARMGAESQAFGVENATMAQRLGLAQAKEGATAQQAQLIEQFRSRQDAMDMAQVQGMFGLGGSALYAGLGGDQQRQGRKTGLAGALLGMGG
jgi:hypothetical protein